MGDDIIRRRISKEELPQMLILTQSVGWSASFSDITDAYAHQPEAFFGAFLNQDNGEMISLCVLSNWSDQMGFVMWFITKKSHQRRGIGSQLLTWAKTQVATPEVCLSAVAGTEPMYKKLGFKHLYFTVTKFSGVFGGLREVEMNSCENTNPLSKDSVTISALSAAHTPAVLAYDRGVYPYDRAAWLSRQLASPASSVHAALTPDGACRGYVILRHTDGQPDMVYIRPLYASTPGVARRLITAALADRTDFYRGKRFRAYVPDSTLAAGREMLGEVLDGLEEMDREVYMCTAEDAVFHMEDVYSLWHHSLAVY